MLISRCAWHLQNYGHFKLLGVVSWRGLRVEFTDGICLKCGARVHASQLRRDAEGSAPAPGGSSRGSEIVVVVLAVAAGLMVIAQPVNDGASRLLLDELHQRPRGALVARAQTVDAPASLTRVRRPRASRPTTVDVREPRARERTQSP